MLRPKYVWANAGNILPVPCWEVSLSHLRKDGACQKLLGVHMRAAIAELMQCRLCARTAVHTIRSPYISKKHGHLAAAQALCENSRVCHMDTSAGAMHEYEHHALTWVDMHVLEIFNVHAPMRTCMCMRSPHVRTLVDFETSSAASSMSRAGSDSISGTLTSAAASARLKPCRAASWPEPRPLTSRFSAYT